MSPPTSLTSEVRGETMGNPDSCFASLPLPHKVSHPTLGMGPDPGR